MAGKPGRPKNVVEESEGILGGENYPEDLADVFDALPGEEKVISLFRIQSIGQPAFLVSLSPEGLRNLSSIQDEFGGGKFKAVAKNFETGEKIERGFSIEGEPKVKGEKLTVRDPKTGFYLPKSKWREQRNVSENEENPSSDPLLRLYERQIDKMEIEIQQLKENRNNNNGGMAEMLKLIIQAKELIAPQQTNQSSVDIQTLFTAMTKGIDLVNEKERDNDQPIWVSLIKELMPQVQQIVNRATTAPLKPNPAQPINPAQPANPPDPAPKDVTPATGFQALIPMLEGYKQTFIDAASNDDNPELLIPLVARRIPPEQKEEIVKWIQDGTWFKDLTTLDQRIASQRAWWEDFCNGLVRELTGTTIKDVEDEAGE